MLGYNFFIGLNALYSQKLGTQLMLRPKSGHLIRLKPEKCRFPQMLDIPEPNVSVTKAQ